MKTQLFRATVLKHTPFLSLLAFASGIHLPIFGDALNPDSTTYLEASRSLLFNASLRIETSLAPRHPPLMAMLLAPFGVTFWIQRIRSSRLRVGWLYRAAHSCL